jgi:hypothetical protein
MGEFGRDHRMDERSAKMTYPMCGLATCPLQIEEAQKPSYHVEVSVHEDGRTPSNAGGSSGAH